MLTNLVQKVPEKYKCLCCDYSTSRKSQYDRHLLTPKHKNLTNFNNLSSESSAMHICDKCNKTYKSRVGLWGHKKKCFVKEKMNEFNEITEEIEPSDKDLILTLIQQNNELQKQMLEVIKNGTNINNTVNNDFIKHSSEENYVNADGRQYG